MSRHAQSKDAVLKAEVSGFSCLMAAMAVKGQKPPLAFAMPDTSVEVLDLFKAKLIVCLTIVADSNSNSCWDASLVPGHLVKLAIKDYEWRDSPNL